MWHEIGTVKSACQTLKTKIILIKANGFFCSLWVILVKNQNKINNYIKSGNEEWRRRDIRGSTETWYTKFRNCDGFKELIMTNKIRPMWEVWWRCKDTKNFLNFIKYIVVLDMFHFCISSVIVLLHTCTLWLEKHYHKALELNLGLNEVN